MDKIKCINDDKLMLRLTGFSPANKLLLKKVAREKRMSVGAYASSVIEQAIKKEARKNAYN